MTAIRSGRVPARTLQGARRRATGSTVGAVADAAAGRQRHGAGGQAAARLATARRGRRSPCGGRRPRSTLGELAGAVERVDDPDAVRGQAGRVALGLLGQDGVVRAALGEGRGEPGLGGHVAGPAEVAALVRGAAPASARARSASSTCPRPRQARAAARRASSAPAVSGTAGPPCARSSPRPACRHPLPSPSTIHARRTGPLGSRAAGAKLSSAHGFHLPGPRSARRAPR